MEWLPNNRALSMITEWKNATNEVFPKRIEFIDSAVTALNKLELTELEVIHALKEGDVEFSHDRTKAREKPKQYYVLIEINDIEYYLIAKVLKGYSEITQLAIVED